MLKIKLNRVSEDQDATYGVLIFNNRPFCATLELPWLLNRKNVSCIPAGEYFANRHKSNAGKLVWWLQDVPNRSKIYIHIGNTPDDIEGCILPGELFEPLKGKTAVQQSTKAFRELNLILRKVDEFILIIEGVRE